MNGNHFFFNSRSILKGLFPAFLIMILFNCNQNLTESTTTTTTTGTTTTTTTTIYGKIDTIENFKSTHLNNSRNIRVYLPKSYDASDSQRYKVVYMHDGQNVFAPGGPYGCWFVEKAYADLQKKDLIEELIIVGINNNSDRIKEYTPTFDAGYKDGGRGELYTKFIIEEVMPYVDKNYKTKTGPENTAIIGSSLGGLISMYIAWNHPEKFGMAGCVSSSFWWDNRNLLKEIEASSVKKNVKFWIDCGTAEGDDGATDIVDASNDGRAYMLEDARRAADK
ncbi:MAG TPA: alpha/beta hydrolase-fold protein, partial [Spirochaetota bacterium]|nr:alpha/beta hydrolase-fold protein [Spirochaetota bacterium]